MECRTHMIQKLITTMEKKLKLKKEKNRQLKEQIALLDTAIFIHKRLLIKRGVING